MADSLLPTISDPNAIARAFSDACTERGSNDRPNLATYLLTVPEQRREEAFQQLFEVELANLPIGPEPAIQRYLRDFPQYEQLIRAIFNERTPPGCDLLGSLGRGGMGVVYLARERDLTRTVALKMVLVGSEITRGNVEMFREEARTLAQLEHPGIVRIYRVGMHNHRPFFLMEFVRGGSLKEKIAGQPQPSRESASLMADLADAIQYAHDRGVIHRDLKPANVLLGEAGEPRLSDFGLAIRHAPDAIRTQGIAGTPQYMAPEQTETDGANVGPHTDIYGLGAILYQLLTGCPPFTEQTVSEIFDKIRNHPPESPRKFARVPRRLEAICLKCLAKAPEDRYGSAGELASDLRKYLRRRNVWIGMTAAMALLLLGSLFLARTLWQSLALSETELAEQEQRTQQAEKGEQSERSAKLRERRKKLQKELTNTHTEAEKLLREAADRTLSQQEALAAVRRASSLRRVTNSVLDELRASADERENNRRKWDQRFTRLRSVAIDRLTDGGIRKQRWVGLPATNAAQSVRIACSGDSKRVVVTYPGRDEYLLFQFPEGEKKTVRFEAPEPIRQVIQGAALPFPVALSPDGSLLAMGYSGRRLVLLLDPTTGNVLHTLPLEHAKIFHIDSLRFASSTRLEGDSDIGQQIVWTREGDSWKPTPVQPRNPIPGTPIHKAVSSRYVVDLGTSGQSVLFYPVGQPNERQTLWKSEDDKPLQGLDPSIPVTSQGRERCRSVVFGNQPHHLYILTTRRLVFCNLNTGASQSAPLDYTEGVFDGQLTPHATGVLLLDVAPSSAVAERFSRVSPLPNASRERALQLVSWQVGGVEGILRQVRHPAFVRGLSLGTDRTLVTSSADCQLHLWKNDRLIRSSGVLSSLSSVGFPSFLSSVERVHPRFEFLTEGEGLLLVERAETLPPSGNQPRRGPLPIRTEIYHPRTGRLVHTFPSEGPGRLLNNNTALSQLERTNFGVGTGPSVVRDRRGLYGIVVAEEQDRQGTLEVWSMSQARSLGTLRKYTLTNSIVGPLTSTAITAVFSPAGRWLLVAQHPENPLVAEPNRTIDLEVWEMPAVGKADDPNRPQCPRKVGTINSPFHNFLVRSDATEKRAVLMGPTPQGFWAARVVDLPTAQLECELESKLNEFQSCQKVTLTENLLIAHEPTFGGIRRLGQFAVWDCKTGKRIQLLEREQTEEPNIIKLKDWLGWPNFQLSPDGSRLFLYGTDASIAKHRLRIELWNLQTRKPIFQKLLDVNPTPYSGQSGRSTNYLLSVCDDKRVYLSLTSETRPAQRKVVGWTWADGSEQTTSMTGIIAQDAQSGWILWNQQTQTAVSNPEGSDPILLSNSAFSSSQTRFQCGRGIALLRDVLLHGASPSRLLSAIWDTRTGKPLLIPEPGQDFCDIDPTGRWAMTIDASGKNAKVWNLRTGQARSLAFPTATDRVPVNRSPGTPILPVRLHPEGDRLVVPVRGVLQLWDVENNKLIRTLDRSGHASPATCIVQHGNTIVSGDEDGLINLWNRQDARFLRHLCSHEAEVTGLEWSNANNEILSAGKDGVAQCWRLEGERVWRWKYPRAGIGIGALAVDPRGKRVAVGLADGVVVLLDRSTGEVLTRQPVASSSIRSLVFSPLRDRLFVGDDVGRVSIWDCSRKETVHQWNERSTVTRLAIVEDRFLVVGTRSLLFREAETGELVWKWTPTHPPLEACSVNPNHSQLAVADQSDLATTLDLGALHQRLTELGLDYASPAVP